MGSMTNCEKCGKLIASEYGKALCSTCREEARAEASGESPRPVVVPESIFDAREGQSTVEEPFCVRCRQHPALENAPYCLACHLELLSDISEAAYNVALTPPPEPRPPVASPASLMSDLEEKRLRTATSHMRVVGGQKLR